MDVFNLELGSNQNSLGSSIGTGGEDDGDGDGDGDKTEEDYMELFVAKELKDKITPIEETLVERKTEFDALKLRVDELDKKIIAVDIHYNGVAKATLLKQGIVLQEVNEYNIIKELQRIKNKEADNMAKARIKRH